MRIIIEIDDDKMLNALNEAFKRGGRPDGLADPKYIDEQDIAQWIVPKLDIRVENIEIERD